jgi:hypothetical protein
MKKIGVLLMFVGTFIMVLLIHHIMLFGLELPLLLLVGLVESIGCFTMGYVAYKR